MGSSVDGGHSAIRRFALVMLIVKGSHGIFVTRPENTVAVEGRTAVLHCSTTHDRTVLWLKYVFGMEPVTVAAGGEVPAHLRGTYRVQGTHPGDYNLLFLRVSLSDAGSYGCMDTSLKVSYAELIVIDQPKCNSDTSNLKFKGESFKIQCSFYYRAPWGPVFDWTGPTYSPEDIHARGHSTDPQTVVNATLASSHRIFSATTEIKSQDITCKIRFDTPPFELIGGASNAPIYEFVYVWNWSRRRLFRAESENIEPNRGTDDDDTTSIEPPPGTLLYIIISGAIAACIVLTIIVVVCVRIFRRRPPAETDANMEGGQHTDDRTHGVIQQANHDSAPPPRPPKTWHNNGRK